MGRREGGGKWGSIEGAQGSGMYSCGILYCIVTYAPLMTCHNDEYLLRCLTIIG